MGASNNSAKLFDVPETPQKKSSGKGRDADGFVFEFMDMLTAPVLTHCSLWADSIPQRLLNVITMERLLSVMKDEKMATLAETAAFIMTRTFEAPMTTEWTNIYCWVACTVCEQHFGENRWDQVWEEWRPRKLTQDEERSLKQLRVWIYERRRKYVKERMKSENKESESAPTPTESAPVEQVQYTLF